MIRKAIHSFNLSRSSILGLFLYFCSRMLFCFLLLLVVTGQGIGVCYSSLKISIEQWFVFIVTSLDPSVQLCFVFVILVLRGSFFLYFIFLFCVSVVFCFVCLLWFSKADPLTLFLSPFTPSSRLSFQPRHFVFVYMCVSVSV